MREGYILHYQERGFDTLCIVTVRRPAFGDGAFYVVEKRGERGHALRERTIARTWSMETAKRVMTRHVAVKQAKGFEDTARPDYVDTHNESDVVVEQDARDYGRAYLEDVEDFEVVCVNNSEVERYFGMGTTYLCCPESWNEGGEYVRVMDRFGVVRNSLRSRFVSKAFCERLTETPGERMARQLRAYRFLAETKSQEWLTGLFGDSLPPAALQLAKG